METFEEYKYYYSNANKEDLLIEAYEDYQSLYDMTNLVSQLQQENKGLKIGISKLSKRRTIYKTRCRNLKKRNKQLKEDNFKLDRESQLLFETILDLITYCETESSIIHTQVENVEYGRFIAFGEILNKLKGDDKE